MRKIQDYYKTKESNWGYYIVMGQSQHIGYYDDSKNSTGISEQQAQRNMHDQIIEYLSPTPSDKVLDIGCGQGFVATDLAVRYGLSITGVDITPYIVERARRYAEKNGVSDKVKIIEGDYSQTDFADSTYDCIYAVETLCHSDDMHKTLREVYRILKKGGKFASLEYVLHPENMDKKDYEHYKYMTANYAASPGLRFFEDGKFSQIAEDVGFKTIKEIDVTQNCLPSVKRLTRYAKIPYLFIKLLNKEKRFVNVWMGAKAEEVVTNGTFGYMHRVYQK